MNGAVLLLAYFIAMLFALLRGSKVTMLLLLLQVASLSGTFFLGSSTEVSTAPQYIALLMICVVLTLVILPWSNRFEIGRITISDNRRFLHVSRFLLGISVLPFFVLLITSFYVITRVEDVSDFKYTPGVSDSFFYSLPINVRFIILSNHLQYFAYFLIPLHFYYLSIRNYRYALLAFVLSLNVVLFGLTFFSRWAVTHYFLIYLAFYLILHKALAGAARTWLRWLTFGLVVSFTVYFIGITNQRFRYDITYSQLVPTDALVQSPTLYSYVSYLSQSYEYGMDRLSNYSLETFSGQITLQPVLGLAAQYRIIDYDPQAYIELRRALLEGFYDKFTGLTSYLVYDFGYFGALAVAVAYLVVVTLLRPVRGVADFGKLCHYVLLIQVPLLAIFYSVLSNLIIPYLLLVPLLFYLNGARQEPMARGCGRLLKTEVCVSSPSH